MAVVKGVAVLVKIGTNVVAKQRGATLNRDAETMDSTAKDVEWMGTEMSFKSWSVECDGLLVEGDAALDALEIAFNAGEKVSVELALPSGAKKTGTAVITSFPIEAPYDDLATYSLTLQGDGALTPVPAA